MARTGQNSTRSTVCSHANAVYTEWAAVRQRLESEAAISVNGSDLSIADVVAVSFYDAAASLAKDQQCIRKVEESVAFLSKELESGHVIYGVNTGFGGSADTRTQQFERLQSAAIQHLNVGILTQADKSDDHLDASSKRNELLRSHALPNPIVKAAMLIRCNSLMRGHSGVRISVIESVINLLASGMAPVVPLRGSISASGDLSTLSYIAGAVEGNPDIFVRASINGRRRIIPANEALETAGITPVRLQAKEGLGITNGTAPSCAAAAIVLHQANQLALLVQLLTAMGTEALDGTAHNYHPFISSTRPHPGQAEAAANILSFLSGSRISPSDDEEDESRSKRMMGLAQDRYALRTAPQWIGPQLEDLELATRQVSVELNSTTDNPLIDAAPAAGGRGRIHHGGNFQAAVVTSAMEKTMTALQNLGRIIFAQSSEMINNMTSKGLPPNLSLDDPSWSFTAKGFDVNMAAYAAELGYLAHPVSTHVHAAEMANQSVNSMALVSARYALEAVEVLSLMAATYIYVLCQALDLRCMGLEFKEKVGKGFDEVVGVWYKRRVGADDHDNDEKVRAAALRKVKDALVHKWDQLSHMDLEHRCVAAVKESVGDLLESGSSDDDNDDDDEAPLSPLESLTVKDINEYQQLVVELLRDTYTRVRAEYIREQKARAYISPASMVVYDFVRKELGIPLNRGVEDHPPLLQETAAAAAQGQSNGTNGHGVNGEEKEDLAARSRIMGTMAGEIYEAVRGGVLHDRIMKFGEESGLWS
ncbi:Phenylalanine/tyrosine ammonia-lyase [Cladorrhinum samala]|uniref:Phenylalanine/tyrosine ammonia-lyase n=1 Tax=Cladorrhinum samala TaxID=585594 RepID=A0AAV9HPL1_9PEZI|nr:Phenylalanine/tyrosine ammonia-lyase [Cladorrhinum samala]